MSNAIFHQQQYIQNSFLKNKASYLSYSQPYSLPLKMLPLDSILIELCQPSKAKPRTKSYFLIQIFRAPDGFRDQSRRFQGMSWYVLLQKGDVLYLAEIEEEFLWDMA